MLGMENIKEKNLILVFSFILQRLNFLMAVEAFIIIDFIANAVTLGTIEKPFQVLMSCGQFTWGQLGIRCECEKADTVGSKQPLVVVLKGGRTPLSSGSRGARRSASHFNWKGARAFRRHSLHLAARGVETRRGHRPVAGYPSARASEC